MARQLRLRRPKGLPLWIAMYGTFALIVTLWQHRWAFALASTIVVVVALGWSQIDSSSRQDVSKPS